MDSLDPYTVTSFYFLDRFHHRYEINELLNDGYTIILDRYVGSNIMYQSTRFDELKDIDKFVDWCVDYEYSQLRKEDITLFMYIPVELNYNNLKNRDNKDGIKNDIYESNKEYQLKLEKNHKHICDKLSWNIVKCYDANTIFDQETIFSNILNILDNNIL